MKFPNIIRSEKIPFHGKIIKHKSEQSSLAGNQRIGGLQSSGTDRIRPRIEFWKRQQFYLTVGRVQNVIENYVLNIINREWYYDDTSEGAYEGSIKQMEDWEEKMDVTTILGTMVRNWIINGIHLISPKDWTPVQLQSLTSKSRDNSGNTLRYYQVINGVEKPLEAKDFIEVPYIEFDREPWPVGMFDSLMNSDYLDIDGRDPRASLELYRQALQDNMKIHHKFASPRVIYTAQGVSKEVIDNDITPIIEGMMPGDRAVLNAEIDIKQETVDGNARFIEHVNKIIDEIDTGLQSSANRLITEPSAMADAREAGSQDDDRVLGIMEKVRIFMNREVIPRVTGLDAGLVVFKWGAKDAFDLEFPDALDKAIERRVISPEKAAIILEENYHWKIPTDDDVEEKFGIKPAMEPTIPEKPIPPNPADVESYDSEKNKLERKIQNEKLIALTSLNAKIKEV